MKTFYGIPVTKLNKDIKSGKYILKSQGNINGNINAQTVIVYGNVNGSIKANEVVVINGNPTGPIVADNIVGLKKPEEQEKTCKSCKYYTEENCIPSLFYCKQKKSGFVKKDIKICEEYQKKENPAKNVSSPILPTKRKIEQKNNSIKNVRRIPVKLSRH